MTLSAWLASLDPEALRDESDSCGHLLEMNPRQEYLARWAEHYRALAEHLPALVEAVEALDALDAALRRVADLETTLLAMHEALSEARDHE